MKAVPFFSLLRRLVIFLLITAGLAFPLHLALAQDDGYQEPSGKFNREELAQMLAPIALYPDPLLSQILMAATYPIEVIEADRWVKKNPDMFGDTLDRALTDLEWDPSVKALCHFPNILSLMSERIAETTDLGNAFLAQEGEVMDVVQELRAAARSQGTLESNAQQTVIVKEKTIIIEPADPRVIYVPYYDPYYVYGSWWWYPAYAPYYWGPPGTSVGFGISFWPGVYFSFSYGTWSYFNWPHHYIYLDMHHRPRYVRHDRWIDRSGGWRHLPSHRHGVAYRDKATARKFGQYPYPTRNYPGESRGFPEIRDRDQLREDRSRMRRDTGQRGDVRSPPERERKISPPAKPERQERERTTNTEKKDQQRFDNTRQVQERTEQHNRQKRTGSDAARQAPSRNLGKSEHGTRDNVFNRIDEGKRERQSSERGRFSREEQKKDNRRKDRGNSDKRDTQDTRDAGGGWGRSKQ